MTTTTTPTRVRLAQFGIPFAAFAVVAAFLFALRRSAFPLGVPGEWEWMRLPAGVSVLPVDLLLGVVGVLLFAGFAALGARSLTQRASRAREACWLLALAVASVGVQGWTQSTAPVGYGLGKWVVALHQKGSSGYFTIAKGVANDLPGFLRQYPDWIQQQDALHIGTHPPGLIVVESLILRGFERDRGLAESVVRLAPESVGQTFRYYGENAPMSASDRATLVATGALTLLACGLTVVPLYLLARSTLEAPWAWSVACFWPVAPSAILFQPTSDTALPLLSTAALACGVYSTSQSGWRSHLLAVAAGLILGIGMQLTLVFLAIGLVVGLVQVSAAGRWSTRAERLVATGIGFLVLTLSVWTWTGANPFVIWWWNQRNHGRFYEEFPRSYLAWVLENPLELAVGLGLPATLLGLASLRSVQSVPVVTLTTAGVLVFLTLGGRNLSEVGRLWLPFMPALLVAAGVGMKRSELGPMSLAALLTALGFQTLALQATIQVVYPV